MKTARTLGRLAQQANINAPTLDSAMSHLLKNSEMGARIQLLAQWWQGWYEGLYEEADIFGVNIRGFG